jgi:hypothetical protein
MSLTYKLDDKAYFMDCYDGGIMILKGLANKVELTPDETKSLVKYITDNNTGYVPASEIEAARAEVESYRNGDQIEEGIDMRSLITGLRSENKTLYKKLAEKDSEIANLKSQRPAYDVTNQWQSKTRGGYVVHHVEDYRLMGNHTHQCHLVAFFNFSGVITARDAFESGASADRIDFDLLPISPEPQYREPKLPEDWGKECEFSQDEIEWVKSKLRGYDKSPNPIYGSLLWKGVDLEHDYKHARIREAGK